ncbi:mitochondrial import inner membrane translocase subunit TIM50-like isoform X2 [Punica granatum]|uniref:Mitochondrial import inner membrane translocase subunit TIM50-like isoform X2 n=1 Tax=Punica granatum TaxID=22663 RepID=A0A6P8EK46_PUNGR|nr:mitochondrial import inner membrane translocase subunit TIM50-like isoform X2 [Punica granatum]
MHSWSSLLYIIKPYQSTDFNFICLASCSTLILWLKGLMASNVYDAGLAGVRPNIRMENIIGNPGKLIYISGHTLELCLQQENCVQIKPWKLEVDDTTLLDLIPFLEFVATRPPRDIGSVLASYEGKYIPKEFIKSSRDYQRNKIIFLLSCLIILDARDTFF